MSGRHVCFYDANVLYSAQLRDFLMRLALGEVVRAYWTERVHKEWMRNVDADDPDITWEDLQRIRVLMDEALPEALTEGYKDWIEDLSLPDRSDRHVLAGAIHARADYIVTFNRRDFPASRLQNWDVEAIGPDELVSDLFGCSLKDLVSEKKSLKRSVEFAGCTEGIDTMTAQGGLTVHIFGGLAEFERDLAHERTMTSLKVATGRGRIGGRPWALDEEDIPHIQSLMQNDKVSTAQTCKRLGISKATLYRFVGPDRESGQWVARPVAAWLHRREASMNRRIQCMPSSGATTALFVFLRLFRVFPTAGSFNHSCAALSPDSVPHRVRVFSHLSPRVFLDRRTRRLFSLPTSDCRQPSGLSKSPAGSASVSFEPKEVQVPERLKMFLYGSLSRILRQVCLDVGERDGAFSANNLGELLLQITEIVLDAAGCHVPSRPEPHNDFPASLLKLWRNKTRLFGQFNHFDRSPPPRFDNPAPVECVGNQIVADLRRVRFGELVDGNSGWKCPTVRDFQAVVVDRHTDGSSPETVVTVADCIREGFAERFHRVERRILLFDLFGPTFIALRPASVERRPHWNPRTEPTSPIS
jgi:predicted nucleic acid-binding protein